MPGAANSVTPFIENDAVLGDLDAHFGGNFLNEDTILKLARDKGYSTAAIGKHGPTLLFDHTERSGSQTIVIDDATGTERGIPVSAEIAERLKAAGLALATPGRGPNGAAGNATTPGTTVANVVQQDYLAAVTTRAVLPLFAARNKPFLLLFWSRDPDGTQHNEGDSLQTLTPGINGPTSRAAIRNADDDLGRIRAALAELNLAQDTDIIVTADHGFSTISKQSASSAAAEARYADTPAGMLPLGFLAIDLAEALGLPLFDHESNFAAVASGVHPRFGNAMIGGDKDHPKLVIATNGGSDLIYIPDGDKELAGGVVRALLGQDYVSGLFVDGRLGKFPGTLSLSDISLDGAALTPRPAIVVNFRSFDTVCGEPVRCAVTVCGYRPPAGPGHARQFQPRRHLEFHGARRPRFQIGLRRHGAGQQCRRRPHGRGDHGARIQGQGRRSPAASSPRRCRAASCRTLRAGRSPRSPTRTGCAPCSTSRPSATSAISMPAASAAAHSGCRQARRHRPGGDAEGRASGELS